jgi:1-acyl-sn-glycerol-3-phosphate acyltransferase
MMQREAWMEIETRKPQTHARRRRKGYAEFQSPAWYAVGGLVVGWVLRFWVRRFQAIGAERVPTSGGAFVISNHTTGMDPFLLGWPLRARKPLGPGKIELFANPVFAYIMRKIGMFPLRQGVADSGAVRAMVQLFRAGRLVIVYPEGGRSMSEETTPFVPDFARLVIKLKAPVIPAGIAGGVQLMPVGSYVPKPNTPVVVVYGEPFELTEYYDRKLTPELAEEASEVMRRRVLELIREARTRIDAQS